ncbi:alpha/beta fold hydrolase [Sinorhizobium alkalisoli]|uniref:alpha/beta fold hydrolase n=1 Tax=Sinorhizobium alkalisoli TaxID=1752398 RepID=UPI00124D7940|nr:alpha/beta hydrolase [Sinorhizobium alkalisoli]QFI69535.1 alpha/beta hydrolase fold [Sinorhizobium alkalisoli]
MIRPSLSAFFALLFSSPIAWACEDPSAQSKNMDIGYIEISPDITLRRMVMQNSNPKGTVLFLHGFPETLCAWKDISLALADDYEVHAFDWPGYGLSSRPPAERFSYAPKEYARVLHDYIEKAKVDESKLTIYATDIGALPALLLALEKPDIAKKIIVGDFAPFNRPQYMYESLQSLKSEPSAGKTRAYMNQTRAEILENAYRRGLPEEAQFDLSPDVKEDMFRGWDHGGLTSADAFYYYYSNFTRDENYFEANTDKLATPVKVIWGEKDIYIKKEMGIELAEKIKAQLRLLPNVGHYPHLQSPNETIKVIRDSFQ